MAVALTIVNKVRNKDYFQNESLPVYSYQSSPSGVITSHVETDRLTGLTDHFVSVVFKKNFIVTPKGSQNLKVYRMEQVVTGKWRMKDVVYYFTSDLWLLTSGFSLTIEGKESLTGVIVEYYFTE